MATSDFRQSILEHVEQFDRDAQLVGQLLENKTETSYGRPNYFYLTDLRNPQVAYWDHLGESPEYTDEQQRLFAHGNRMETVARRAFSNIDGFSESEATLDGAENDLHGIRGKVDFRYQDSLVEFKTSEFRMDTSDDIWNKAPQDIEQLLFYSVMWAYDNDSHYLIYHLGDGPESLRVFKVTINDAGELKTRMRSRKADLEYAIENEEPTILGRCRYYDHTCHIGEEGICDCQNIDEINTAPLQEATEITRDDGLEREFIDALQDGREQVSSVRSWDLYTPRQWYARQFGEQERSGDFLTPEWVYQALDSANLTPGPLTHIETPKSEDTVSYYPRLQFVKRIRTTSQGSDAEWLPARIIAKDWATPRSPERLRNQFMQVACASAVADSNKGLLIIEMPKSEAKVDVIEIQIHDSERVRQKVRERLDKISEAVRAEDSNSLPICPDWLQDLCGENCLCE